MLLPRPFTRPAFCDVCKTHYREPLHFDDLPGESHICPHCFAEVVSPLLRGKHYRAKNHSRKNLRQKRKKRR